MLTSNGKMTRQSGHPSILLVFLVKLPSGTNTGLHKSNGFCVAHILLAYVVCLWTKAFYMALLLMNGLL